MIKTPWYVWILKITAAVILLQSLYFKFSAHPEAIFIFTKLGMEPNGRIGIGIFELITATLILIPRTTWLGALLGVGLMAGAIYYHLTILGIVVYNDGGKLFALALITLVCCITILIIQRKQTPILRSAFATPA